MSDGFTIGAASYASTLFPCPNCKETIDSTTDSCRFCGQKVDHEAAQAAAQLLSKINQACSDASYLKSSAFALPVFFVLRFLPIISMLGVIGFIGLTVGIPVWALRWWLKFGGITTDDAEFLRARTTVRLAGIIVSILLVLFVIVPFLIGLLAAMNR